MKLDMANTKMKSESETEDIGQNYEDREATSNVNLKSTNINAEWIR